MGVFDFIREAGAKIGLEDNEREEAAADTPASERAEARKAELKEQFKQATKSAELEKYVKDLGLAIEDLDIRFVDGTATIEGTVASQADLERVVLAVGNVEGVATVDEQIDVAEPSDSARMYTVVKGDSLSKIAKEFYGDATKYPVIFEANQPMLKDPDLIYPGQVLRMPTI